MSEAINEVDIKRIENAINTSRYRWRTPKGISEELGIPKKDILILLEYSPQFMRARDSNGRGEPLFTTKDHYQSSLTLTERMLAALTNNLPGL